MTSEVNSINSVGANSLLLKTIKLRKIMTETYKIRNIKEFARLYKINIPIEENFDYYINLLKKSPKEYQKNQLDQKLCEFSRLEDMANNANTDVYRYTLQFHNCLIDYIESSQAYKSISDAEFPTAKRESRDRTEFAASDESMLMSLDFSSANYSVLKTFDNVGELKGSWAELCQFLNIPVAVFLSKSFRQIVFGQINPKRFQAFQHVKIMQIISHLKGLGYADEQFMFISHDEIIVKIPNVQEALNLYYLIADLSQLVNMPIKEKYFSLKKLKKGLFLKKNYTISSDGEDSMFDYEYDSLHGAPGSKYYMFFKEYILKEPFDARDLVHLNDGQLCQWVVKEEKKVLPHYEKPDVVIDMVTAKAEFSYIWDGLDTRFYSLSNEEKRRIIELIANACRSCWQEKKGCHCWNDE